MAPADGTGARRTQSLLVTLLGDYWRGRTDAIPSGALVDALREFGVSSEAARSALSRLVRRQLLERSRQGRRTAYRLTGRAQATLAEGAEKIFSFGARPPVWNGRWSLVAFSVSEDHRELRHALRTRLGWWGFAPLYDGLWVSPHPRLDRATEALAELGISNFALFDAEARGGLEAATVAGAWDLATLADRYQAYVDAFAGLVPAPGRRLEPGRALVVRTEAMDAWRAFPGMDPDLPEAFLPARFPRERARRTFLHLWHGLAPAAEAHVADLVGRHGGAAAGPCGGGRPA